MAKKKIKISPIFALLSIVCAVVSFGMMFVKSINVVGYSKTEYPYTGLQAVFGVAGEKTDITQLEFSFMNLIPYILLAVAVILIVLSILKRSNNRILNFVICGLFIASGILFFCEGAFTVLGNFFDNGLTGVIGGVSGAKITVEITVGAIVAAICSIVGGLSMLASIFTAKKSK